MIKCNLDGCQRISFKKGMCRPHYKRAERHGDPTKGRRFVGDAAAYYEAVVLPHESDECLDWPFNKDKAGYGLLARNGKNYNVSRLVCLDVHGLPPNDNDVARHLCGKGHEGCCNKRHLAWGSHKDNMHDMDVHGISHGPERLLDNNQEIVKLKQSGLTYRQIAAQLGVGASTVSRAYHRGLISSTSE